MEKPKRKTQTQNPNIATAHTPTFFKMVIMNQIKQNPHKFNYKFEHNYETDNNKIVTINKLLLKSFLTDCIDHKYVPFLYGININSMINAIVLDCMMDIPIHINLNVHNFFHKNDFFHVL